MLFDDRTAADATLAEAFDAFVGGDFDEEGGHFVGIGHEEAAGGFVVGVDRHGAGNFDALGGPGGGGGGEVGEGAFGFWGDDSDGGDFEATFFLGESQRRAGEGGGGGGEGVEEMAAVELHGLS